MVYFTKLEIDWSGSGVVTWEVLLQEINNRKNTATDPFFMY